MATEQVPMRNAPVTVEETTQVTVIESSLVALAGAVDGGRVKVDAALVLEGDVEIGAVEIKDATTGTRAVVGANGLAVYLPTAQVPPAAAAIATAVANPDGVTFAAAPVAINIAPTVYKDLGAAAGELTRLHELCVKASVADTIILYSDDDGAGTNKAELCRWGVAATGGPWYPFRTQVAACFKTAAVSKHLSLYAATATLTGFAVTSHKAT